MNVQLRLVRQHRQSVEIEVTDGHAVFDFSTLGFERRFLFLVMIGIALGAGEMDVQISDRGETPAGGLHRCRLLPGNCRCNFHPCVNDAVSSSRVLG